MDIAYYSEAIKTAIKKGEPVEYSFGYIDKEEAEFIIEVLGVILQELNKTYLMEEISYVLREFVTNANKSNLKRVYFNFLSLDIHNPENYRKGMETFAKDLHDKLSVLNKDFQKYSLYTKVAFQVKGNVLKIEIRNSNCTVPQEKDRILGFLKQAKRIRDIAEAYQNLADTTEGTGLGLISSMLMLRSMGLDEDACKFIMDEQKNETVVSLDVFLDTVTEMQLDFISDLILSEIKTLPVFPEQVQKLQKMISDEDVAFSKVAEVIQSDVALTAELLRIVNSAQYMLPQKVSNITNAISLIGIKGLKALLYSYGTQNVLTRKYGRMEQIWQHAYQVASYAYHLAREILKRTELQDDAYIGGILHDMGKIIITQAYPGLMEKINNHCMDKGINGNMIERLALGISHAKIGAEIARHWNFPDNVVDVISYHHKPLLSPDESKDIVHIVYLANILAHMKDENFYFSLVEKEVLKKFNIKTKKELIALGQTLDKYYQEQIKKASLI